MYHKAEIGALHVGHEHILGFEISDWIMILGDSPYDGCPDFLLLLLTQEKAGSIFKKKNQIL